MISLGYDQPAQKAPVTLKRILDMLRDCFRCYWFVDEQNQFRIEHISWFMRGGSYSGQPVVGRDLTTEFQTRNGKKLAFGTSQYQFDKPEMAARYQFGWMDDVTQLFEGNPIDIVSKYVNPDNIEQIDVSQFTSDVDYILLNPGEISKDGFVLLGATLNKINASSLSYEQGGISYTADIGSDFNAMINGSATRITSDPFNVVGNVKITGQSGYKYFITFFDENNKYLGYDARLWITGDVTVTPIGPRMAITIAYALDGNITPADAYNITISIQDSQYKLPYVNFELNNVDHILQNAYAAFIWLQQYYFWDMPARYFKYNGEQMVAQGIKKLKTQTLKFPAFNDPNTLQLIKTNLGNGTIQKMSVNLSSRNANTTLKYDTE